MLIYVRTTKGCKGKKRNSECVCVCERAERNGAGEVCPQNNLSDFEVNC